MPPACMYHVSEQEPARRSCGPSELRRRSGGEGGAGAAVGGRGLEVPAQPGGAPADPDRRVQWRLRLRQQVRRARGGRCCLPPAPELLNARSRYSWHGAMPVGTRRHGCWSADSSDARVIRPAGQHNHLLARHACCTAAPVWPSCWQRVQRRIRRAMKTLQGRGKAQD